MSLQDAFPDANAVAAVANEIDTVDTYSESSEGSDTIKGPASVTTSMSSDTVVGAASGSGNISIRTYIFFLPFPLPAHTPVPYSTGLPANNPLQVSPVCFEPTWTVVLTAPSAVFVDLRFGKPTTANIEPGTPDVLDWGFAGHSESVPLHDNVTHSTWHHFVDSRYSIANTNMIPIDEGDMYPISANTTLEHGHAFHPQLGAVCSHEEMWTDEDITSTSPDGKKICVVMRAWNDEQGIRGTIVRLGKYIQGILVKEDHVSAERWEWFEAGGWKRTKRVGNELVPCAVTIQEELLTAGMRTRLGVFEWKVEGLWEL
jgi:hypothetical protein